MSNQVRDGIRGGLYMAAIRMAAVESPDLLKPPYDKGPPRHPLAGHCYVAAEALYHATGGRDGPWVPHSIRLKSGVHWFLAHRESLTVLDPTAPQFADGVVPYHEGHARPFLTVEPSKRAAEMLKRAGLPQRRA